MLTCTRFLAVASFVAVFAACSGEGSTDSKTDGFSADVADKTELETYECNMDVVGEKVYVKDLKLNYECDGEKWFESYDQTKPGPSSSVIAGEAKQSSSSEKIRENGSSSSSEINSCSSEVGVSSSDVPEGYVDPSTVVKETMTDERDGQTYKTVTIGTQTWMAENLNYAYIGFPYNKHNESVSDSTSWCYRDDPENCTKYGRLYTWSAAMDSAGTWSMNGKGCGYGWSCSPTYPVRGVCPKDWHLPSREEFVTLFYAVGGNSVVGKALKSKSGWKDHIRITNDDAYGFSALPAGFRHEYGKFNYEGGNLFLWSSLGYNSNNSYLLQLLFDNDYVLLSNDDKNHAFSVRCIKDTE